jgi:hypothetical protein
MHGRLLKRRRWGFNGDGDGAALGGDGAGTGGGGDVVDGDGVHGCWTDWLYGRPDRLATSSLYTAAPSGMIEKLKIARRLEGTIASPN